MIEYLRELNFISMTVRILLAVAAGGLIGLERERKNRGAGFRTYMLVALGSSLTIILSQYLNLMLNTTWSETAALVGIKTDVSRFGAQVINGVGFLGAGTVIVTAKQEVKGLTTAAGLWTSACMGLAIGAGFFECVVICFIFIIIIMEIFPFVENALLIKSRNINVSISLESIEKLSKIIAKVKNDNIRILDIEVDKTERSSDIKNVNVFFSLRLPEKHNHDSIIAGLSSVDGVISIDEV